MYLLKEPTNCLTQRNRFYEIFIILGDFNIHVKVPNRELDQFATF